MVSSRQLYGGVTAALVGLRLLQGSQPDGDNGDNGDNGDGGNGGGPGTRTVQFVATSLSTTNVPYTVQVAADSQPTRVTSGENPAESTDTIAECTEGYWEINGQTGTASGTPPAAGDTFEWTTSAPEDYGIVGFTADPSINVLVDGASVEKSTLPALQSCSRDTITESLYVTGSPTGGFADGLGGGPASPNRIFRDDSRIIAHVSTATQLTDALGSASSGDIVWIEGDAMITSGPDAISVPDGVTIASDRGTDGSPGGLIGTLSKGQGGDQFRPGDDVRFTGLRVRGPYWDQDEDAAREPTTVGIDAQQVGGSNLEVDNCEIYGWGRAGVASNGGYIHHCDIHHIHRHGYGYALTGNYFEAEWCSFNWCRHGPTSGAGADGFTIRDSWLGPMWIDHCIDHHGPDSGSVVRLIRCTVEHTECYGTYQPGASENVYFRSQNGTRGYPDDFLLEDCWFVKPEPPTPGGESSTREQHAIYISVGPASSWSAFNARFPGTVFGTPTPPDPVVGHPR